MKGIIERHRMGSRIETGTCSIAPPPHFSVAAPLEHLPAPPATPVQKHHLSYLAAQPQALLDW